MRSFLKLLNYKHSKKLWRAALESRCWSRFVLLFLLSYTCILQVRTQLQETASLETQAILIEISMLCWNLPSSPKHLGSLQKNIDFLKGNKLFAGDFCANLDEKMELELELDWTGDGTGNGLPNIKDTSSESLQLQMSVLHQSMSIFKAGLSSQVHMMAGQNVKKSLWCVRSHSKYWNNMEIQTQIYIT